ncbi:MAG: tetratricopeptide repeat protein, partial [bacterium]
MKRTTKRKTTDDKETFERIRKAAERGDSTAQSKLGVLYSKGQGVIVDDEEAVKWFRKAAAQG